MDKPILLSRWKPYHKSGQISETVQNLFEQLGPDSPYLYCALPYSLLGEKSNLSVPEQGVVGADNMPDAAEGSFLGEAAGQWVADSEAAFVLLGAPDRRKYFDESDAHIGAKVRAALSAGVNPILCVGETEEDAQAGSTAEVLQQQIQSAYGDLEPNEFQDLTVVYQGAWPTLHGNSTLAATLTASVETLQQALQACFGDEQASNISVLLSLPYSMHNCEELITATYKSCNGYYVDAATTHSDILPQLIKAIESTVAEDVTLEPEPSQTEESVIDEASISAVETQEIAEIAEQVEADVSVDAELDTTPEDPSSAPEEIAQPLPRDEISDDSIMEGVSEEHPLEITAAEAPELSQDVLEAPSQPEEQFQSSTVTEDAEVTLPTPASEDAYESAASEEQPVRPTEDEETLTTELDVDEDDTELDEDDSEFEQDDSELDEDDTELDEDDSELDEDDSELDEDDTELDEDDSEELPSEKPKDEEHK